MTIQATFRGLCPNCGGDITTDRLEKGLPCSKCLPDPELKLPVIKGFLYKVWDIEEKVRLIDDLFVKAIGSRMWGLQRLWARRFFNNESFAMVAPTGSGKTTMQIILALYAASLGKRSLILLPTSLLAHQVYQKAIELREKLGLNEDDAVVVAYHSLLTDKQKREMLQVVDKAKIIITTPISLMKKSELQQPIDIAFIDDVDSFLRRSKSVDVVLRMLGITDEEVSLVERIQELESRSKKLAKDDPETSRQLISEAQKLRLDLRGRVKGLVVVSGATQTARRTKRVKLLNTLYGFTVGGKIEVGRNIVDLYIKPKPEEFEETIAKVVKRLGTGGLVFVPMDKGAEYVKKITEVLKSHGIKAEAYLGARKRIFEKFVIGELDVLVGIASYRSPLTRGIDLPERVRYAVFTGVPKFRLRISIDEFQPSRWLILLNEIKDVVYNKYAKEFDRVLGGLIKIRLATRDTLEAVREALKKNIELEGFPEFVRRVAKEALDFLNKVLKDPEVVDRLRKSKTITFGGKEGEYFFII
ncbi:MAG TPA: DEAD/DEAH box helicase, partial [Acidilobales archaeon]|nr:DEAD/DEAH box helicase [Acidilobales archaeon]